MNDVWRLFLSSLESAAASPVFGLSAAFSIAVAAVYHWTFARPRVGNAVTKVAGTPVSQAPADVSDLRNRVAAIESAMKGSLQNVGFVRFNAFSDVGSELSYSIAVVDGRGDGFVVSSIYSREEVRTYAKAVKEFNADKEVSTEEREALQMARDRASRSSRQ